MIQVVPDSTLWSDLARQAPALAIYAVSALTVLRMILSHLKTENTSTRKVLHDMSKDMRDNTSALVALTEAVRGIVHRGQDG